jgi:serine protease Do
MKSSGRLFLATVVLLNIFHPTFAQSENDVLPRRGYFGVGLEKAEGGARVFSVAPDSTAAAMGIIVGDVIESIDGHPATAPEVVVATIAGHKSGESVQIDLRRDSNRRTINATLQPLPLEQMANATIH